MQTIALRGRIPGLAAAALLALAAPVAADTPTMEPHGGQMDGAYSIALGLSLRPVYGTLEVAAAMTAPRNMDQLMIAAVDNGTTADDLVRSEVVALAEMQDMRAGFDLGGGMTVRFGFDISHSLNGQVVQRLVMPATTIAPQMHAPVTLTDSQGSRTLPGAALPAELQTVANAGQTRLTTSLGPNGIVSHFQNQANDQLLQRAASFTVDISGMRNMLQQGALQNMVSGALTARRMLGR